MKKFMLALSLSLAIGTVITLNSCQKGKNNLADDSISAQDNASINNAINATTDDAASAAGQVKSFSGKTNGWWNSAVLCGVTIVDSGTVIAGNKTISITYDGTTTCNGVIRSGNVTVQNSSGITWNTAGSVLTVTFNALAITDPISGNTYTVNGTHTLTKETNGLEWQIIAEVLTNQTVTRRNQSSNMSITFPDGSVRTWSVDRTRSWSSSVTGSVNTITVTVSSENANHIDATGTNRYGNTFTNTIVTPIMANNNLSCTWKPYQGETQHVVNNRTTTVVFGTNLLGTQIGNATTCGDGYYITYSNGIRTLHRFVAYW